MTELLSSCRLCPRACGVDRTAGKTGFCGADSKIKIARAALHFWEEPPISGTAGSGAVFFSHCTMKCVFCQNYGISTQNHGYEVTPGELADIFLDLQSQGALNINLVTPTHYAPQIITALDAAKARGFALPVVYNSGGYESVEAIKLLKGYVDIYLPDFKYYSDKYSVRYSNAPGYFAAASAALAEMYAQVGKPRLDENGIMRRGVIVRHMLLPGLLFDSKKVIDYLYRTYGNDIYISIMNQYTPMPQVSAYPEINKRVPQKYYDTLVNYAYDLGVRRAFTQSGEAVGESFIPDFFGD